MWKWILNDEHLCWNYLRSIIHHGWFERELSKFRNASNIGYRLPLPLGRFSNDLWATNRRQCEPIERLCFRILSRVRRHRNRRRRPRRRHSIKQWWEHSAGCHARAIKIEWNVSGPTNSRKNVTSKSTFWGEKNNLVDGLDFTWMTMRLNGQRISFGTYIALSNGWLACSVCCWICNPVIVVVSVVTQIAMKIISALVYDFHFCWFGFDSIGQQRHGWLQCCRAEITLVIACCFITRLPLSPFNFRIVIVR